jgi:uncharacterized membrane protein
MKTSYNEACARDCSTLEKDLALCEKAGFDYIEIRLDLLRGWLKEHTVEQLKEFFETHRLKPHAINAVYLHQGMLPDETPDWNDPAMQDFKLACEVGSAIGSGYVIIVPPLDPAQKPKAGKDMSTAARRSAWLKLRVTPKEKEAITAKATMQGQTVTDFLRQRALDYRLRQTPLEKERIRQLARIGANLNQLARWANTWKSRAEAVEILAALVSLERALLAKDTAPPAPGEPSCI